jgi:sarcosine oxidase subunit alpha
VTAFLFEGRAIEAAEGQSLGAALHAAGVTTLSWSARTRTPRGLRCCRGACPCCQVRVDGLPGVLACMTPVRGGEVVERERPAASWSLATGVARRVPVGFQHAAWLGRPAVWRRAERGLARLAGVSRVAAPMAIGTYEERAVDVLVAGAGPRGLTRAIEQAVSGASVLVADRDFRAGGRRLDRVGGAATIAALLAEAETAGVAVLLETALVAVEADGACVLARRGGLLVVRPGRLELATGSWDRELALAGGDRPGVLVAGAARRLALREGVAPGTAAVIVAAAPADDLADVLAGAGTRVAAVVAPDDVVSVQGRPRVTGVSLRRGRVRCDVVVVAAGLRPADELARQ